MEQTGGEKRASVVMLKGHGTQRLQQAIMQGLVQDDLVSDFNEVLQQNGSLLRQNNALSQENEAMRRELNEYKRIYFDAMRAWQRAKERKKQFRKGRSAAAPCFCIGG